MAGQIALIPHSMILGEQQVDLSLANLNAVAQVMNQSLDQALFAICYVTDDQVIPPAQAAWNKVTRLM